MRALSAVLAVAAAAVVNAASWKVQVPNIGSAGVAMSFINNNVGFLPINDVRVRWGAGWRQLHCTRASARLTRPALAPQNGIGATVLKTGALQA